MRGARNGPRVVRIATGHGPHVVTDFRVLEEMAASARVTTEGDRLEPAVADRARKAVGTKGLVRDADHSGVDLPASDGKRPCHYPN